MKRWTTIRYLLLGIVIWTLIMVFSILAIHLFGPHSPCLVPQSAATPTQQERAMGVKVVCTGGIPSQSHSSPQWLPERLLRHQLTPNGISAGEHPTTLQVQRRNHLPGNRYLPFSPRTITDQQAVQRLYTAAQALPPLDLSGIHHCPANFALDYQLDFFLGQTRIQEIVLHPTGCSSVDFGNNDLRVFTPAFEHLFMQTVGISNLVPGPL
jgi:hypothetical protein